AGVRRGDWRILEKREAMRDEPARTVDAIHARPAIARVGILLRRRHVLLLTKAAPTASATASATTPAAISTLSGSCSATFGGRSAGVARVRHVGTGVGRRC